MPAAGAGVDSSCFCAWACGFGRSSVGFCSVGFCSADFCSVDFGSAAVVPAIVAGDDCGVCCVDACGVCVVDWIEV